MCEFGRGPVWEETRWPQSWEHAASLALTPHPVAAETKLKSEENRVHPLRFGNSGSGFVLWSSFRKGAMQAEEEEEEEEEVAPKEASLCPLPRSRRGAGKFLPPVLPPARSAEPSPIGSPCLSWIISLFLHPKARRLRLPPAGAAREAQPCIPGLWAGRAGTAPPTPRGWAPPSPRQGKCWSEAPRLDPEEEPPPCLEGP